MNFHIFFSFTFLPLIEYADKNSQNEKFVHCIFEILYKINRTMQKYWLQDVWMVPNT